MAGNDFDEDAVRCALDRLPLPYSEALRLRMAGISDSVIADILGVDSTALPGMFEIAEAKLGMVLRRREL
ncbi:hypothetical protein [Gordonia terrae]|uniref:hypothetical protein n=1 Tax=Gordonia terrae TaxID=2055 RepID=UPI003F6A726F